MLFDLRGRGRRRAVQFIYLLLAVLMGGGLILFGIGGATSGGLLDAFTGGGGGGGNGSSVYQHRIDDARKKLRLSPQDAQAWASLAQAEYQIAGTGDNYDQSHDVFTDQGRQKLHQADQAWQKYLALNPKKVDPALANQMVQVYAEGGLNQPKKAVEAQEIVIDNQPPSYGQFATLAVYAYEAGQSRKGDLAAQKALQLAPHMQRSALKQTFAAAKLKAPSSSGSAGTG